MNLDEDCLPEFTDKYVKIERFFDELENIEIKEEVDLSYHGDYHLEEQKEEDDREEEFVCGTEVNLLVKEESDRIVKEEIGGLEGDCPKVERNSEEREQHSFPALKDEKFPIKENSSSVCGELACKEEKCLTISTATYNEECKGMLYLLKMLRIFYFQRLYAYQISDNRNRGRPRVLKNTNPYIIWNLILKKISSQANKRLNQRTDAQNSSVCRDALRVPNIILKHLGSKCRYKSSKESDFLESYSEAFTVGCVPTIFEGEQPENKVKVFCEFIVLYFPASKVRSILSMITKAGFLTTAEQTILVRQLKERNGSSKVGLKKLVRGNSCLSRIMKKLLKTLDASTINHKEAYRQTLLGFLD
ncbi:unnamed protein product [Moneuplotes crassus]|uniref:Uncharacterized protein n=1 Tax=Euplotes crassus TaxID=5936 RepID=A0AAD1UQF5_EUPCR|nr:unnamed protein product [Moneuplotes crassus]